MPSLNRQFLDLQNQRATHLAAAEAAITDGNQEAHAAAMEAAVALNPQMEQLQTLMAEQSRFDQESPNGRNELQDRMGEEAEMLRRGEAITFTAQDVRDTLFRDVRNATTLASGDLVRPTRTGSTIRDGFGPVNAIIDMVTVVDLSGTGGIKEPYAVQELEGKGAIVETAAGTARPDSTAGFRSAAINPYEVSVTSFVDRNISRLTNVPYWEKIRSMALTALLKKVSPMIYSGDGEATPAMFGLKTAVNTKAEKIYAEHVAGTTIDPDTLMNLYFAYRGDEELGGGARLLLTKADLAIIGNFRGTNEKGRLFHIKPDESNLNNGVISDGGYNIPFTLTNQYKSMAAAANGEMVMGYGNLLAYHLGLFGGYEIRISDDFKAQERMLTILGDVMVGGNLVVDKAFVNAVKGVPIL